MSDRKLDLSKSVSVSTTDGVEGKLDPEEVFPFGDSDNPEESEVVGMLYKGNGYGDTSSWIACEISHLKNIEP